MSPEELQIHFIAAVLYYCGVTNSDATRYYASSIDVLSPAVGTMNLDVNYLWYIDSWAISGYSSPSNATLAVPALANVLAFFNNAYFLPDLIKISRPFPQLTSTQITSLEPASLRRSNLVENTTTDRIVYYSGSAWTNLY